MNIAIWGMGVSGLSALRYLSTTDHHLTVINSGPLEDWGNLEDILKLTPRKNCLNEKDLDPSIQLDQIILAPGIDRKKPIVKSFLDKGVEVICEVELAYRHMDLPIVAITGTNGKTTTATMMELAFSKAGKRVFLGGNIGVPLCDLLLDKNTYDLVVLELSSFQLESLKDFHAQVAIVLNITESHMERYDSFRDYEQAKLSIVMNQKSEDLFLCPGKYMGTSTAATKACVSMLAGLDFSNSKLIGEHQKENLYCIKKSLEHFKVENVMNILQEIVDEFAGVKFRLEYAGEYQGKRFINDGKSTNIDATISAIKTLESEDLYLILGGKLRSDDVSFVDQLQGLKINQVLCFGEAANKLKSRLSGKLSVKEFENLDLVFEFIKNDIGVGTILFSPAFPSFDLYANYIQRGKHFKELVDSLRD